MLALDTLLERPGLPVEERLLIRLMVSIWPGDLEHQAECVVRCRRLGVGRSRLEEALLQAVLFCGFPRVINAFQVLQDEWPATSAPRGGGLPVEQQRDAGDALFETIYGKNTESVKDMLLGYHAELHDFVLDTAYGRILSRPGLEPRIRELLAVGILALTEQTPQLVAHGRGAMRFGATEEQLREAVFTAILDEEAADGMLRKILASRCSPRTRDSIDEQA